MLQSSTDSTYLVFPSHLRHLRPLTECQALYTGIEYWRGFSGGGILSHPFDLSQDTVLDMQCQFVPCAGVKYPYGTEVGNMSAKRLAECVHVVQTEWEPDVTKAFGSRKRSADPQVKVTIEHLDDFGETILLLIVPKRRRKLAPFFDNLKYWFGSFHVQVSQLLEVDASLRQMMSAWFRDIDRNMYMLVLSGESTEAAWHLAVLTYIAVHWDLTERGLDSLHVLADIAGKPNFRMHWTSNR